MGDGGLVEGMGMGGAALMRLVGPQVKRQRPLECQPGLPFNRINA